MQRKELQERLSEKFFRHDVATTMSAIPFGTEEDITQERLRDLLEKGRFWPHEIAHINRAVFN